MSFYLKITLSQNFCMWLRVESLHWIARCRSGIELSVTVLCIIVVWGIRNEFDCLMTINDIILMSTVCRLREFLERINRFSSLATGYRYYYYYYYYYYHYHYYYYYYCYYYYLLGVLCRNKLAFHSRNVTHCGCLRKKCWSLLGRNKMRLEKISKGRALKFWPFALLLLACQNQHVAWVVTMVQS
jgi:hypothetical protein